MDGQEVARIAVKKSGAPAYMDPSGRSEFFVRNGTTNQRLNSKETVDYVARHFGRAGA